MKKLMHRHFVDRISGGITLKRHPIAALLIVLNTIFTIWASEAGKDASQLPLSLLYSSGFAIVFSAVVRLVAERFAPKKRLEFCLQLSVLSVVAGHPLGVSR